MILTRPSEELKHWRSTACLLISSLRTSLPILQQRQRKRSSRSQALATSSHRRHVLPEYQSTCSKSPNVTLDTVFVSILNRRHTRPDPTRPVHSPLHSGTRWLTTVDAWRSCSSCPQCCVDSLATLWMTWRQGALPERRPRTAVSKLWADLLA